MFALALAAALAASPAICHDRLTGEAGPAPSAAEVTRSEGAYLLYMATTLPASEVETFTSKTMEAWRAESLAMVRAKASDLGATLRPEPVVVMMNFMAPQTQDGEQLISVFSGYLIVQDEGREPAPGEPVQKEFMPGASVAVQAIPAGGYGAKEAMDAIAYRIALDGWRRGPYVIIELKGEEPAVLCQTLQP